MVGSVLLYLGGLRPCSEGQAGKERRSESAGGYLQGVSLPAFHSPRGAWLQGTAFLRLAADSDQFIFLALSPLLSEPMYIGCGAKGGPKLLQSG